MAFSEVREYQFGDDVRDIDWNVTARHNKPYIKVFEEERELTVMLLIDVSASRNFGAVGESKKEMMTEIAATLAFSTIQNNDKIGVIFFSDKIEKFIPPQKGRKHVLYIIRELIEFKPENSSTDISLALEYVTNAIKKRCTLFLLSDFVDTKDYRKALTIANNRHDLVALQIYDKREREMPNVGLIKVKDSERGGEMWIDTSSRKVRDKYAQWWINCQQKMIEAALKSGVDITSIATDEDYVRSLMTLFERR